MGKEISTLEDTEIEKNKFYRHETSIFFLKCTYWESISI